MVRRYVLIKVEGIKQSVLVAAVFSHHAGALPPPLLSTKTLKSQHRSIVFQRNRSRSDRRRVLSIDGRRSANFCHSSASPVFAIADAQVARACSSCAPLLKPIWANLLCGG